MISSFPRQLPRFGKERVANHKVVRVELPNPMRPPQINMHIDLPKAVGKKQLAETLTKIYNDLAMQGLMQTPKDTGSLKRMTDLFKD